MLGHQRSSLVDFSYRGILGGINHIHGEDVWAERADRTRKQSHKSLTNRIDGYPINWLEETLTQTESIVSQITDSENDP